MEQAGEPEGEVQELTLHEAQWPTGLDMRWGVGLNVRAQVQAQAQEAREQSEVGRREA